MSAHPPAGGCVPSRGAKCGQNAEKTVQRKKGASLPARRPSLLAAGYYRFRGLIYCLTSATVYIGVYYALQAIFDVEILHLGIYLPLLVVEPLDCEHREEEE